MAFQTVFKRYELKYVLTLEQKEKVLEAMSPYMELDTYGRSAKRRRFKLRSPKSASAKIKLKTAAENVWFLCRCLIWR